MLTASHFYSYKIVNVNVIAPASLGAKKSETDYVWRERREEEVKKTNSDNANEPRKYNFSLNSATEKLQSLNCYLRSFLIRCQFILLHIDLPESFHFIA